MKLFKSITLAACLCQALLAQDGNELKLKNINLALAFSKQHEVPLSKFIENINFIPLETTTSSLIGESADFEVTKDYIIVRQNRTDLKGQMLLFDKNTGKYIREIGKYGKGPGEYFSYCYVPFNPIEKTLYTLNRSRNILVFDLSGKTISEINTRTPSFINSKGKNEKADLSANNISWVSMLDSDIFVGYVRNNSGKEDKKIVLLSKQGIIKIFPNHMTWNKQGYVLGIGGHSGISQFYRWNNKISYYENFCDTLFYVTKESLIPRYYFDLGSKKIPYSKQGELTMSKFLQLDFILISQIFENSNYIFLKVVQKNKDYLGFVDKNNSNATFCKPNSTSISTFKDDIYNLLDILPDGMTEENEMTFIVEPSKLLKWFKENPEKGSQLKIKQPVLNNIDEFSNPIIAIGKCK